MKYAERQRHSIFTGVLDMINDTDPTIVTYRNGAKGWYVNHVLHREDGPAVMYFDKENNYWYYKGEFIPVSNQKQFQSYIRNKAFW